jgi:hypothetical protein
VVVFFCCGSALSHGLGLGSFSTLDAALKRRTSTLIAR